LRKVRYAGRVDPGVAGLGDKLLTVDYDTNLAASRVGDAFVVWVGV